MKREAGPLGGPSRPRTKEETQGCLVSGQTVRSSGARVRCLSWQGPWEQGPPIDMRGVLRAPTPQPALPDALLTRQLHFQFGGS